MRRRTGFRLYRRWRSRARGGRARVSEEPRGLIRRLAMENPGWGAPPEKTQYTYAGETTTIVESGGAARILETDALGRLKSAAMGTATAALPGKAEYTYDALDNLTGVTQTDATTYGQGNVKQQARQFSYSSLGRLTAATNPESGQVRYEYFANGALKKRTDARGAWTEYEVDGLNRVTKKPYGGIAQATPEAVYCYDGKRYASGVCQVAGRSDYAYGMLTGFGTADGWTEYRPVGAGGGEPAGGGGDGEQPGDGVPVQCGGRGEGGAVSGDGAVGEL